MEIIFKESAQTFHGEAGYEAEFEVTGDFNLHLERRSGGRFFVYQKTVADGKWDMVDDADNLDHKAVIDLDFTGLVYPKWIKVVSESEPTMAVVTFNA